MSFDVKSFLKHVTSLPGIYQMIDSDGSIIYIGKARNLRKRLKTYFNKQYVNTKLAALVKRICDIRVIATNTDSEALILEHNLIKKYKPKFNILLKDDKSYPYIFISADDYPRIDFYRGDRQIKGEYFGPFPNVSAVREALNILTKLFRLRQCRNSYFQNRTRPCLQFQINRCTAPCVKAITLENYQYDVSLARLFLQGKSYDVIKKFEVEMQQAADQQDYEQAAIVRDKIQYLQQIQSEQVVSHASGNCDVIAIVKRATLISIQVMMVRAGMVIGNHNSFPKDPGISESDDILFAFIQQYYLSKPATLLPRELIINMAITDHDWLAAALTEHAGFKVVIKHQVKAQRAKWLKLAIHNATLAASQAEQSKASYQARIRALQALLQLPAPLTRMECFDVSHTQGEATVASCVVFDNHGPLKSCYRRFNITGITKGDDYAAMTQALTRRFQKAIKEASALPDLLIIDGGRGQVTQALTVLANLNLSSLPVIGIAKGPQRKVGMEALILAWANKTIHPEADDLGFHLIQQLRDEAHRFAIAGHRGARGKKRNQSILEQIEGVGPRRRKALLTFFGGLQSLQNASVDAIAKVNGINHSLAKRIYDRLHKEE